ncbi:vitamin B12-dependent ribonucleotide reductase [Clostridium oceanicum]|uniref:Vitamin B12-dependent ribonucleotide reductase n=1 Tax=Clostridium oceanicum TaxID=1543 RepID=A0ABP3UNK2_9CLOT
MINVKNLFKRYYTKSLENNPNKNVYDLFKWKKVDVLMKDFKTNKTLVYMKNLEFPSSYSQTACDIIASKYFRKAGVPTKYGYETSLKMVAHRMVNFWTKSLIDENLITTKEEEKIFYDEVMYILLNQMFAPNSPQWFNTGLALSYGIKGNKQGLYYFDKNLNKIVESSDTYTRTQASACFIVSIKDKLLGSHSISEQFITETKLFKGGSGTGSNYSSIRAIGEKLSGGGESSGLMSFLKALDRNAGAIKSGGTTRRAAKMVCLDVDHPEILDFITWKSKEEDKVRALGKMGYSTDFEGEAYETVSGQNANNSIQFSDEFMKKVETLHQKPDETIRLKGRVDSSVDKIVNVSDIWESFNESAFKCADPAPQFSDTFNAWHTCPAGEDGLLGEKHNRINSTNPCGEYAFLDDSSCNLASMNVFKFYDVKNKIFDVEGYIHSIGLIQLVLESSINWGQFPTEDIARKTHLFRTTGLGISNLASLLMVMGYPYDSHEGRTIASSLIGILTGHSYFVSSLMAKEIGTFSKYDINKKYMLKVIRNHARVSDSLKYFKNNSKLSSKLSQDELKESFEGLNYTPLKIDHDLLKKENLDYISSKLKKSWNNALEYGYQYGYRNAQVSVIAPTGTISFAMDCGSTSIEPFFSHIVYKKLAGGGHLTMVNPVIKLSLENLGYSSSQIKDILNYVLRKESIEENGYSYEKIIDGKIEDAPHIKEKHLKIFDTANKCGSGKRYIAPMGHVLMVASITPLISGAISKTVNLPNNATIDNFKYVTLKSWKLGIKGITLYRDGCKASQPLNTTLSDSKSFNLEDLSYKELLKIAKDSNKNCKSHRDKPIGIRNGTTHPAQIEDVKIYTTVNRNEDNEICEIYITTDREGTTITGLLNSLSKTLSVMLQYHVPPFNISKMLRGQNYEPHGFVQKHPYIKHVSSISDLVSKIIDIELGDFSRCQIKPKGYNKNDLNSKTYNNKINTTHNKEQLKDYSKNLNPSSNGEKLYGESCPFCSGNNMVKNGTCKVCMDCGSTTGCS